MGEGRPWRFPIAFGDEQLHGFEPFLPLRIVTIAHADEAVTILREKLLRALLALLEVQPHPRGGRLGGAPGWRGAVRGAAGARIVDRGRGPASAALRQHRVRERKLPENADHAVARPLSADRVDNEPGPHNVPIPIRRAWGRSLAPGGRTVVAFSVTRRRSG